MCVRLVIGIAVLCIIVAAQEHKASLVDEKNDVQTGKSNVTNEKTVNTEIQDDEVDKNIEGKHNVDTNKKRQDNSSNEKSRDSTKSLRDSKETHSNENNFREDQYSIESSSSEEKYQSKVKYSSEEKVHSEEKKSSEEKKDSTENHTSDEKKHSTEKHASEENKHSKENSSLEKNEHSKEVSSEENKGSSQRKRSIERKKGSSESSPHSKDLSSEEMVPNNTLLRTNSFESNNAATSIKKISNERNNAEERHIPDESHETKENSETDEGTNESKANEDSKVTEERSSYDDSSSIEERAKSEGSSISEKGSASTEENILPFGKVSRGSDVDYDIQIEYDFIIVGSGAGGSVLASRLSEHPGFSVLLLEAGPNPDEHPESYYADVPYKVGKIPADWDWAFKSEPQRNCCLRLVEQRQPWPRGRVLGGTTTINNNGHTRGNKFDYDYWADGLGNWGWRYNDILPYFLKNEDYLVPMRRDDAPFHAKGGLLPVSTPRYRTPLADAWLQAGRELGYPEVDHNARYQTGFMYPVSTMKDGEAYNMYKAFLKPFRSRKNLHVLSNALVTKIIFERKVAVGVEYEHKGSLQKVTSKNEVIISAGAVQSPQLLMLSGIGPQEILETFQIPIVQALPGVGKNLINHMSFHGLIFNVDEGVTFDDKDSTSEKSWKQWRQRRTGPLTSIEKHEGKAYLPSSFTKGTNTDLSDIEIKLVSYKSANWGMPQELYDGHFAPPVGQSQISFIPILLHPKSKGFISIRSTDIHEPPIIQPNSLADEQDVEILLEAARAVFDITNTTAFRVFGTEYHGRHYPDCKQFPDQKSDAYWLCVIKHYSYGFHHPVGTCKMGPDTDPLAVLDPQLKVRGVRNLRVVDASVMPTIVSAHTSIPTVAIAEKAAHLIKTQYGVAARKV